MFEDSRTYYEKMCNVNLTVEEVPEDMAETCLFTLSAEQLISESIKTMAVWALPLEEKIEIKVHTDGTIKPDEAVKESCAKLNDQLEQLANEFRQELQKFVGEDGLGGGIQIV